MGSGSSKKSSAPPSDKKMDQSKNNTQAEKSDVKSTDKQPEKTENKSNFPPIKQTGAKAKMSIPESCAEGWQFANLSELMQGLELQDDSHIWEDYVDSLVAKKEPKIKPETKRKGWKTVRLFVSSTFKDMHSERDYLVKKVFPQLRQWCEERKLRLIECDLRWGVPKDADTRETLMACLSEIDRCREENQFPYFLNMMSERYGWVPSIQEVPDDIRARYKWMPGMSVTTSEIMVGGYWDRNSHALFLFRTPDYLEDVKDEKLKSHFVEKDEEKVKALSTLKEKIKNTFPPQQVFNYSTRVDGVEGGRVILTGLEEMGQKVLKHFKQVLAEQYPTDSLGLEPSTMEILRAEHDTFMFQRSQVMLGRDDNIKEILSYIEGDKPVPLVLIGLPGSGKSALTAYCVKQSTKNEKQKVFYHFVGATPGSTELYIILLRFFLEFMPEGTKAPSDLLEMKRFAATMFENATKRALDEGYSRVVVFFDALNQMDDEGDVHNLNWLPKKLPEGMRLIVSTLEGKCLDALRQGDGTPETKALEHAVNPLDKNIRKDMAAKILAEFNKKLDDEQMELLVTKEDCGKPLWLTIACEELRVYGEFRKLTQKIKSLPENMTSLLEVVLKRVTEEYGQALVQATLCLVETSRFGLLETELLSLLALQPTVPGANIQQGLAFEGKLPMAKWAVVYVGLRPFLRPCGSSGEGRLDFHHRTTSKAVRKMFLSKEADRIWWHKRLTEYFETCTDIERKAEELPYHLEQADDKEKLKKLLVSQDMFNQMYRESDKQRLMKYWLYIGGYKIAAEEYVKSSEEYIKEKGLQDIDDIAPLQTKIAWFLCDIGEYNMARDLLNSLIDKLGTKHGQMGKELADPINCMIFLLYRKALQYVYSSHPGYQECVQMGSRYADLATQINKKYFSADKRHYGRMLCLCGYFKRSNLDEAKQVFESINDQQGLAEVLYMLAEKNQYHSDLSVPTELFTKSMTLCLSVFGKLHTHTARCAQLYGQMYWNNMGSREPRRSQFLNNSLELYSLEVEVLSEILGPHHPNTVRSREDVIIILQTLGRNEEANVYLGQQPKEHEALDPNSDW